MEHDYDCLIVFLMKDITLFHVINFSTNNKSSRNGCYLGAIHVSNFLHLSNKIHFKTLRRMLCIFIENVGIMLVFLHLTGFIDTLIAPLVE
jgi:hypothetical protein